MRHTRHPRSNEASRLRFTSPSNWLGFHGEDFDDDLSVPFLALFRGALKPPRCREGAGLGIHDVLESPGLLHQVVVAHEAPLEVPGHQLPWALPLGQLPRAAVADAHAEAHQASLEVLSVLKSC